MNNITVLIPFIILGISFFFSMLGLGGAQLYVPIFYWLGMSLKSEAIPMALLLNFITQVSTSVTYLRKRLVDIVAGLPLLITSTIFPVVGANFTDRLSTRWIILIIGIILISVSIYTFFDWKRSGQVFNRRQKVIIGLVAGSLIGFIVGFIGHGGGTFVVSTLLVLGFAPKNAAATSSFICAFSSLTGFLTHASQVQVNWSLYLPGVIAAVIGSQLGSRFMAARMKSEPLKRLFAIVLFLIGIQLVIKEFFL
jgi:uncharacterized membrane protein YfcA